MMFRALRSLYICLIFIIYVARFEDVHHKIGFVSLKYMQTNNKLPW